MHIEKNVPLAPLTTFRIGGKARYFCRVETVQELEKAARLAQDEEMPVLFLGSGSNMLISDKGFAGLVIKPEIFGIEFVERGGRTEVIAGAGENWDELVSLCVARGLYGLENLSGIPGTVGAAPIQNIGAYGSEVKDVTASVEVYDTKTRKQKTLSRLSCKFGYRDSIFKREGSPYVITNVRFSLAKEGELNLSYRDMREFFEREKSLKPDLKSVRAAVLEIRSRKFPDLEIVGTAGSFFKNPIVAKSVYISLKKKYPELPGFPAGRGKMKLSLAWIIDHVCKLKDLRAGDSGVAPHQTLVICNFGSARATEIKELADRISKAVYETTGITIEPEVKIIP